MMGMTQRLASACLALIVLGLVGATPRVEAGDAHLDAQTVFYMSTDDWGAMRSGMKASDFGRFLQDPEIRSIVDRLETGFTALVKAKVKEQAGTTEEGDKIAQLTQSMLAGMMTVGGKMCTNMTGRTAFSIGMFMKPEAPVPVNVIFEFGGGDEIQAAVDEFLALVVTASEGEATKAEFSVAGYSGYCVQENGIGIYVGRKGDRYILGMHEAGIAAYVGAQESKTVGLGNVPFHQNAMAKVGRGTMRTFLHLEPVWGMVMPMLMGMPGGGGEPSPMQAIQASGIQQLQGLASSGTMTAAGMSEKTFVGMSGRSGLMRLVPAANKPLAPPPFAPAEVVSSNSFRLEISQVLNVVRDFLAMAPEAQRAQFDAGLAQAKELLGFSLDELLGDLEGTVYTATPVGPPPNLMAMMMGGGGTIDASFALKLNSADRVNGLLAKFADPQISQGMISKQEIAGRAVHVITPAGAPMQFATAIEGDWWIIALSVDAMRKSLERVDSGKNLTANPAVAGLFGEVGGTDGMMVSYKDNGASMANMLDLFRPILGMAPMFMPPEAQDPAMQFLFDVTILPSSATVKKYFGVQATRWSVTEGGLLTQTWAPSKTAPKKEEPAKEKTGTGL